MDINFNIAFLKNVYEPLKESLDKASANIKSNIQLMNQETVIKSSTLQLTSKDYIHEAYSVLEMIELKGVCLVLDNIKQIITKLKSDSLPKFKDVFLVLDKSIDNVSLYIEQLHNGENDNPNKLYDTYKNLKTILGEKNYSQSDLFFPKIDLFRNNTNAKDVENYYRLFNYDKDFFDSIYDNILTSNKEFLTNFKKLNYKDESSINTLETIILNLQNLKINKHWHVLLQIYQSYFAQYCEQLRINKVVEESVVNNVIESMLLNINYLVDSLHTIKDKQQWNKIKSIKSKENLTKTILFNLAVDLNNHPEFQHINLIEELNQLIDLKSYVEQINLKELVETHLEVDLKLINKLGIDFSDMKTQYEFYANNNSNDNKNKVISLLDNISQSLIKVNLANISQVILRIKDIVESVPVGTTISYNDVVQKELSIAINFIEKIISNFQENKIKQNLFNSNEIQALNDRLDFVYKNRDNKELISNNLISNSLSFILDNEKKKVLSVLYKELSNDLTEADSIIHEFFNTKGENIEELFDVVTIFENARGVLFITGKEDLSNLILNARNVFNRIYQRDKSTTTQEVKEASQHVAGISMYAHALSQGNEASAESFYIKIKNSISSSFNDKPVVELNLPLKKNHLPSKVKDVVVKDVVKEEKKDEDIFYDHPNNSELSLIFYEECEEVFQNFDNDIIDLKKNPANVKLSNDVRRHFHTFKGSAKMIGLIFFAESAWVVEQTLNKKLELGDHFSQELMNDLDVIISNYKLALNDYMHSNYSTLITNPNIAKNLMKKYFSKADFSFDIYERRNELDSQNKSVEQAVAETSVEQVVVETTVNEEIDTNPIINSNEVIDSEENNDTSINVNEAINNLINEQKAIVEKENQENNVNEFEEKPLTNEDDINIDELDFNLSNNDMDTNNNNDVIVSDDDEENQLDEESMKELLELMKNMNEQIITLVQNNENDRQLFEQQLEKRDELLESLNESLEEKDKQIANLAKELNASNKALLESNEKIVSSLESIKNNLDSNKEEPQFDEDGNELPKVSLSTAVEELKTNNKKMASSVVATINKRLDDIQKKKGIFF